MLSLCCPCAEKVPLIFWIPQQIHLFIFFVLGKMALEFNKDLFHIFRKTLNFFSPWFIICRLDLVSMPRGFKAIVLLSLELELLTIWQLADYIKEMSRVFKVGCDDICLYACNSNVFFFFVLSCFDLYFPFPLQLFAYSEMRCLYWKPKSITLKHKYLFQMARGYPRVCTELCHKIFRLHLERCEVSIWFCYFLLYKFSLCVFFFF